MKFRRHADPESGSGFNEIPLLRNFDYSGLFYYFLDYHRGRL
jgi:hypothetical protein